MEESVLFKLIKDEPITDSEIGEELYVICDRVHAGCNSYCPVFRLNGNKVLREELSYNQHDAGYDCFKSGKDMLSFIRRNI